MDTHKFKHGDSIWIDVKAKITPITPDLANDWPGDWEGSFSIKTNLADANPVTVSAAGSMVVTATPGKFAIRVDPTPDNATPVPNGTYFVTAEIRNPPLKFKQEVAQDKLIIQQEGA